MTRTRTASQTADTTPAPAPVKKTAAKKAPAKRTTATKPRTPRARAPRKATALSLVKETHEKATEATGTVVDLRYPLKPRRKLFVGPMDAHEQAGARAALASAMARLPIPVAAWNGPTARLTDGTRITHTDTRLPAHNLANGQPPTFTAHIPCPHGGIHQHTVHTTLDLAEARAVTRICNTPHGGINADQAIRDGVTHTPDTQPVLILQDAIPRVADTQPLSTQTIADGLTARAADNDTPREHPGHA